MWKQQELSVRTSGRGTHDLTADVGEAVRASGIQTGLCHVFIRHTSASLMLCENADPAVRKDLETFMAKLAPDGDPMFSHDAEGPDDMPSHVRTLLTESSLSVPIAEGRLALGTWQGIYLWEHRYAAHERKVLLTMHGQ